MPRFSLADSMPRKPGCSAANAAIRSAFTIDTNVPATVFCIGINSESYLFRHIYALIPLPVSGIPHYAGGKDIRRRRKWLADAG